MVCRWPFEQPAARNERLRAAKVTVAGLPQRLAQEGRGVQRAGGLVLVLEVDVDFAVAGELDQPLGEGGNLLRLVASGLAQAERGVADGGVQLGRAEVLGFGDAERGVVLAQDASASSVNQLAWRNSNAMGGAPAARSAGAARKSRSSGRLALKLGGSWNSSRPSLPASAAGATKRRNSATWSWQSRRRLKCVMRCGALNEKRKPGRHLCEPLVRSSPARAACERCSSPRTSSAARRRSRGTALSEGRGVEAGLPRGVRPAGGAGEEARREPSREIGSGTDFAGTRLTLAGMSRLSADELSRSRGRGDWGG